MFSWTQNCYSADAYSTVTVDRVITHQRVWDQYTSFCSEPLSKSGYTHVCHYSWIGQLWLDQRQCTFQSLSMGGSHSQVEGYIASPTFPLCWYTIHSFVPRTTTVDIFCVHYCSTNSKLRILVRAQLRTQSTWPLSPTRLAIWLRDLGPTQRIHSWSLLPFCCF